MACRAEASRPSIPYGTTDESDFPVILLYVDDCTPATLAPGQREPSRSGWDEFDAVAVAWSNNVPPGRGHHAAHAPGPSSWHESGSGWQVVTSTATPPHAQAPPLAPASPPPPPPPAHRAVRWETNEERLQRARAGYCAQVKACPRRGLTTLVPNPMVASGFSWRLQCTLGDPCATCKAHPASLWYQAGETWFDLRSNSPELELRPGEPVFSPSPAINDA